MLAGTKRLAGKRPGAIGPLTIWADVPGEIAACADLAEKVLNIVYNWDMKIPFAKQTLRSYQRTQNVLAHLDLATKPYFFITPGSAPPRGNIVVFPGSFNPPTNAHLAMLRQARVFARKQGGDWQVYAALSKYSVDKEAVERMTLLDRVVLLERVLKSQGSHAGIMLLNRGLYVEQARGLRAAFPRARRLLFLVGFDKIVQIGRAHV